MLHSVNCKQFFKHISFFYYILFFMFLYVSTFIMFLYISLLLMISHYEPDKRISKKLLVPTFLSQFFESAPPQTCQATFIPPAALFTYHLP